MTVGLIVCGALAKEVLYLREKHGWDAEVFGVAALLHNRPELIPETVCNKIREVSRNYQRVVVVYGDCGTAGKLDDLLALENVERIAGPHCYEMYANRRFETMMESQPGTFFLTDYLVQSFEHLVLEGLGIDKHPELLDVYFRNYTRVLYLAQREDGKLLDKAKWAADELGLPFEYLITGHGSLESRLLDIM